MKRITLLLLCMVVSTGLAFAQTKKVTGKVTFAEDGEPVIGASVSVKGTTTGTVTDIDGNYSLNVPESAHNLIFTYVGMITQSHAVKPVVNVVLQSDTKNLEEVVVTGYGNFKKASFTGAASSISTEKLKDIPSVSIQNKLAGSVSGVQITSTSGQPGAVESVRIRGMGSINAGNDPLYVIDGVPMNTGNASSFSYSQSGNSILSTINSNDIESMTVIKDAAAASLYGSRAANGVIVITTKKGKSGKTKINLKADWGFSDMAVDYRPTLGGEARRELQYLGYQNYYLKNNAGATPEAAIAFADKNIDTYAAKPTNGWTDWKNLLLKNGSHQSYEVSAQGGGDKTQFFSSISYVDQQGITLQSGYKRLTGRLNLTHKVNDRLSFDASTTFAKSDQDVNSEGTSFASPIMALGMTTSPSSYPYNEDGTFNTTSFPAVNGANPLQTATYNYDKSSIIRTLNTVGANLKIWDGFSAKQNISYDFNNTNNRVWWDPRSNDGRSSNGVMQRYVTNRSTLVSQTQLLYANTFAEAHTVDGLLAYEIEDYRFDNIYANGNDYPAFPLPEIGNASNTRAGSQKEVSKLVSYVGRLNYDYRNKYYGSVSFRRDGTSRLARDSRWGNFWSVSGSWRITQESFMERFTDILTDAKVRASYGVNGTQPKDYYGYMGLYQFGFNYNGNPGMAEQQILNKNLKWEKNYAANIGLELTFLNRFSATVEWYNRDTKDLLMERPVSPTTGFSKMLMNVGEMRNRGFEIELKSTNINTKDFSWSTTLNMSRNKNTLVKLDGDQDQVIDGQIINKVGHSYYSFYMYEYAGVDPATGKEMYFKNRDGDRSTTTNYAEADRVIVGTVEPKLVGGLTNNLSWKFIDLGFTFTYSIGGHALDNASWLQSNGGTYNYRGNIPSYYKIEEMWQQPGDNAKLPQFVYGNANVRSSRWLMPTDHLRLKNLTVGFTAPSKWAEKLGLARLRAYASGNNLFTIKSKDLYVDPETPTNGVVTFETPALRTMTFGIEVGF